MNDIRRVYIEGMHLIPLIISVSHLVAAIREIYPLPAYNQHFPSEVVEMMSTSRALGTSIIGLTQAVCAPSFFKFFKMIFLFLFSTLL